MPAWGWLPMGPLVNRFENQTAVITGGATGIGFAIAEKLAGEGAKIWLLDRDTMLTEKACESLKEKGWQARFMAVDISDETQVKAAFDTIGDNGGCSVVSLNIRLNLCCRIIMAVFF